MKKLILLVLLALPFSLPAQTKDTTAKTENDFIPVQLFFVMLIKGNNRTQDSATAAKII